MYVAVDGSAVVNNDDPRVVDIASNIKCKKITYSLKGDADIRAVNIERNGLSSIKFSLQFAGQVRTVNLNNIGLHNVANALCASACGLALDIPIDQIADALANFTFPFVISFAFLNMLLE